MEAIAEKTELKIGDRVWVKDVVNNKGCKGIIRFMGSVDFVDDMSEWYGVELDSALGKVLQWFLFKLITLSLNVKSKILV